jgi:hypothetical protein
MGSRLPVLKTLKILMVGGLLWSALGVPALVAAQDAPAADLAGIKSYLVDKAAALRVNTDALKRAATQYYFLAEGVQFDYQRLWSEQPDLTRTALNDARAAWLAASPTYEQIEGVVAGVPSLAEYDVILDAGASGAEGGDSVVPFDLILPDGRMLAQPGNLFGVTESTLWGTDPAYAVPGLWADLNGDGVQDFGEALPDANVLYAGAATLDDYTGGLQGAADAWPPTESDAFTALVVMVPTMAEYFDSWKTSRFVAGEASTQRDFVAISRLSDIQDILSGLQLVYAGVSPLVQAESVDEDQRIADGLRDLRAFVADIYAQEQAGRRFTAEEADTLGAEAQNRATAITGQITQMAARLNIPLQTGE